MVLSLELPPERAPQVDQICRRTAENCGTARHNGTHATVTFELARRTVDHLKEVRHKVCTVFKTVARPASWVDARKNSELADSEAGDGRESAADYRANVGLHTIV
jgi:predicted transglutaminase-like cysteine proteinase